MAGAKFKYDLTQAEPVVMDLPAVNATYTYGQILIAGAAEAGGVATAADGDGKFAGVSNEAQTLAGTQAAGTIGYNKTIVNPFAVYAVPYTDSARITWGTVTDTTIPFTCTSAEGHPNIGGGWAWSYASGKLDYVVSSATSSTTCTLTTVTGTDTTSATGILLYPAGSMATYPISLESTADAINADKVDLGVAGTAAITGIVMANVLESRTYGSEVLKPSVHNQKVRYMSSLTSQRDRAVASAYVCFSPYSILVA